MNILNEIELVKRALADAELQARLSVLDAKSQQHHKLILAAQNAVVRLHQAFSQHQLFELNTDDIPDIAKANGQLRAAEDEVAQLREELAMARMPARPDQSFPRAPEGFNLDGSPS